MSKDIVSFKDSQGMTEYKLSKQATKKLINKAKHDTVFTNAKDTFISLERKLDKFVNDYHDDGSDMSAGEYYSIDIADAMDTVSNTMEKLSDYAEKNYSHCDRAMYSGFNKTQRALDLWNAVGDIMIDFDNITTVDDMQDLLEDDGDIGNADQRHAMDRLDDMDSGAYCQDLGGGDIEYLDPDDASDFINEMVDTIRNYQNGKEQIY